MAAKQLKRYLGDGGAGLDQSHGQPDPLYEVLGALIDQVNDLTAQFNQLLADHNAGTVPSSATTVTQRVTKE